MYFKINAIETAPGSICPIVRSPKFLARPNTATICLVFSAPSIADLAIIGNASLSGSVVNSLADFVPADNASTIVLSPGSALPR